MRGRPNSVARTVANSSEEYRARIRRLVDEIEQGPVAPEGGGSLQVSLALFRAKCDALNAISKAAIADKQLEDLATLKRKLLEAHKTIEEIMRPSADERHNRATRILGGRAAGTPVEPSQAH